MNVEAMQKAAIEAFKQKADEICKKYLAMPLTPQTFCAMEAEIDHAGEAAKQAAMKALMEAEDPKQMVLVKDGQIFRKKKPATTPSSAPSDR